MLAVAPGPAGATPAIYISSGHGATEVPAAVLENLAKAMLGLKGLSELKDPESNTNQSRSSTDDAKDHDDLDYTDLNWTGGRYDYQAQKDFIKKMVLHFSGYKHDPKKSSKERYEERKRILQHRNTQHRRVFSLWPASKKMENDFNPLRDNPKGLAPPNAPAMWDGPGIWGATLFDHYNLAVIPGALFQTSGSKMLKWCLEQGDSYAAPQMAWAMTEPEPELVEPCDIGKLIEDCERRVQMFPGDPSVVVVPPLQAYIPQHLLPETLVVCDPDKLLYTSGNKGSEVQQRYKLKFSVEYDERRKQDKAREAEAAEEDRKIRDAFLADPHTRNEFPDGQLIDLLPSGVKEKEGPTTRKFFYVYPSVPTRAPIKEAQLHVSKEQFLGVGNHSFVYEARFVLPRTSFFDPQLCDGCISEDIRHQVSEYKFSPSFFDDKVGKMVYKDEPVPAEPQFSKLTPAPLPRLHKVLSYEGPLVMLKSTIEYSHEPCHKHRPDATSPPATAEVRVVAKFSKEDDLHLAREAQNYQRFPRYLFEHWSGLIKVPGLRNPVPAGPVVPQFYGYYVPEGEEVDAHDDKQASSDDDRRGKPIRFTAPFLSPILLVENCGKPIEPEDYGYDDTQECCSLVYRLRHAGFLHASVAKRNIVAQQGPLCAWPFERMFLPGGDTFTNPDGGPSGKSFRLIDFGRTEHVDALDRGALEAAIRHDQDRLTKWADGREVLK
ncbi:hypothetical protein D9619_005068 [Psilocybe cf. subviscida]|uniref:Protein kinase domain-containing protein n=1 Tax=Psilocybe cf. subviscida TaxID=2480587 RepID=A0A8H5BPA0_9AGAR|nr:hypothetical protein D9619_005068 [Psilocybe cf. subviscida]